MISVKDSEEEKNNDYLGTESIGGLLLKLSLPAILAQIINLLYNLVDRVYIGHMEGDGALALTGVGNSFTTQIIISVILTIVLWLFHKPMLMAFGASENTIGYASSYMSIYTCGTIYHASDAELIAK